MSINFYSIEKAKYGFISLTLQLNAIYDLSTTIQNQYEQHITLHFTCDFVIYIYALLRRRQKSAS